MAWTREILTCSVRKSSASRPYCSWWRSSKVADDGKKGDSNHCEQTKSVSKKQSICNFCWTRSRSNEEDDEDSDYHDLDLRERAERKVGFLFVVVGFLFYLVLEVLKPRPSHFVYLMNTPYLQCSIIDAQVKTCSFEKEFLNVLLFGVGFLMLCEVCVHSQRCYEVEVEEVDFGEGDLIRHVSN